jgi:hypothetical protein
LDISSGWGLRRDRFSTPGFLSGILSASDSPHLPAPILKGIELNLSEFLFEKGYCVWHEPADSVWRLIDGSSPEHRGRGT